MPTKNPVIQTVVSEVMNLKFEEICKIEDCSKSNLAKKAIKRFIAEYEEEHGEIEINSKN